MLDMKKVYDESLALYRKAQFNEALAGFNKCLEMVPGDGPSQVYVERCKEYIQTPPPANWDGVYNMKTK